jgi:molecular chaperone GrpE
VSNENPNPEGTVSAEDKDNASSPDPASQVTALTEERNRLAAENAELQDRLLRRQADFENYRRRAERDRSEFLQFAGMEFARAILPVLDDFERALKVESADGNFTRGVELIYSRLFETLKKMGLEPMDTVGKEFDPNLHQAVDKVESEDAEDQTILDEFQRGYNFRGKLLRPAMVKVAVKPS